MRRVAVIDIGKTNAKVLAVDLASGAEEVVARVPNAVLRDGPYPHHDLAELWEFILLGLSDAARGGVDAVSVTTHGAAAVLVDAAGEPVLPLLDYEHDGPSVVAEAYAVVRPGFAETGSPRWPLGLNLGAQLFGLAGAFPLEFARARHVLTLPQYW
ncbi:MAG: carbohydrate kinase, partial [Tabrizicola sp.]